MKTVFEKMAQKDTILKQLRKNPLQEAMFFALYDFVKQGNDLGSLPWFALTDIGRAYREKMAFCS